ncbi:unnamed protein product [Camellia sinensis]
MTPCSLFRYPIVLSHIQILCDHQTSPHLTSAQTTVARHRHLHRRKSPPAPSHPHRFSFALSVSFAELLRLGGRKLGFLIIKWIIPIMLLKSFILYAFPFGGDFE